jgi:dTDP-D-glucose 4,6-dehydratase
MKGVVLAADHANYSFVRGSICDAPALEGAMRDCDTVVHFVAESHENRSTSEQRLVFRSASPKSQNGNPG